MKFCFIMKTLEVSDFWLWFSNSRMFGTASCNSLDFPSWMQMTPQYPVIAPVFKAERREVEPAATVPFI